MTETPGQVHSALVGLLDALQVGSLIVLIDRVVPLERLEDALAALEGRQVRGKLVLEIGVDEGHSAHAL
jgi:NADPH:quinone reductase-like Zn-dependent oxidoreductase